MTINYHRAGAGPTVVLIHGIAPSLAGLATGDPAPRVELRCDRMRFARLRSLRAAARGRRTDGRGLRGRVRGLLLGARGRAPARRRQLDGRRNRARTRAATSCELGHRDSPRPGSGRLGSAASAQLSLDILGSVPRPLRPAVRALAATRLGRAVLFKQIFGWPTRMPPDEAVSTLDDAWAAPAFAEALCCLRRLRLQRRRRAPRDARNHRVGEVRSPADLLAPSATGA